MIFNRPLNSSGGFVNTKPATGLPCGTYKFPYTAMKQPHDGFSMLHRLETMPPEWLPRVVGPALAGYSTVISVYRIFVGNSIYFQLRKDHKTANLQVRMTMKMKQSKYSKLLERLETNTHFLLQIRNQRSVFSIPNEGFESIRDSGEWYVKTLPKFRKKYHEACLKLADMGSSIVKQQFGNLQFDSGDFAVFISSYIVGGKKEAEQIMARRPFGISYQSLRAVSPKELANFKKDYPEGALFVISPDLPEKEVLDFFRSIYRTKHGMARMMMAGHQESRVRGYSKDKKERHKSIYRMWQRYSLMNASQIKKLVSHYINKYAAIAEIISKETGKKVGEETLRTIVRRMSKGNSM